MGNGLVVGMATRHLQHSVVQHIAVLRHAPLRPPPKRMPVVVPASASHNTSILVEASFAAFDAVPAAVVVEA
jgi:hypothetical protein